MGYQPRILEKFENTAASVSVALPLNEYELETAQGLRVPTLTIPGAHYGYDPLGTSPAIKEIARERLRCAIIKPGGTPAQVDTDYDELKQELWSIGRGKLFSIDSADVRRWAWARAAAMPGMSWRAGMIFSQNLTLEFMRYSDWYSPALYNTDFTITSGSHNITVNNTGNAPVYNAIIIVKGTFTNPQLHNQTSDYIINSTRDGTLAAHWLKFDAGRDTIEWSTNSGTSYADDYANYARPTNGQAQLMVINPGNNTINVAGANGATVTVQFYPAFH